MTTNARREGFLQAVADTSHAMYRVALCMLRNPDDAQDAVSEALEATWRRVDHIKAPAALPAYLMRCTVNACHQALKRRKRETTLWDLEPHLPPVFEEAPVWMYLSGLPDKYRLPLLLRYSEQFGDQEIADILGMRRGTVASRLSRGLKMLKKQMEKEEMGRG